MSLPWGHPEVLLINGNGVTLGRDLESMNPHIFYLEGEALAAEMTSRLPGHAFRAVQPGATAVLVDGELREVRASSPFLSTEDPARWPARGGSPIPGGRLDDFAPATSRAALTTSEQEALTAALAEFGRFLFARTTYRGLYRLMAGRDHPPSMQQTLALALRDGEAGRTQVWEFRPRSCEFVRVVCERPRDRYVAGGEFWASDLLAALTCRALADDLFHFGRKRLWNAAPQVFRCDLDTELQLFAHALRLPEAVESLYRSCLVPSMRVALRAPSEAERATSTYDAPTSRRAPKLRPLMAPAMPLPSDSATAFGGHEPLDGDLHAALRECVAQGSAGAWTLDAAHWEGAALCATLAWPSGSIALQVTARADTLRFYRAVGPLAFSYGPGAASWAQLACLDRVIVATAATIAAHSTSARLRPRG